MSDSLIDAARSARQNAYAPYSNYPVGAAVEMADGSIYTGCNVENVAFPQSICAERVAIVKAVSEGRRTIRRLAVVTKDGGMPCGGCRSVIAQFAADDGEIFVASLDGDVRTFGIDELIPHAFERDASLE